MADGLNEPDLVLLARVIDHGSFARAAAELDVPPSTLSRRVAAMERRLGVRALKRTTRHLRPTDVGDLLAERGRRVRMELEEAERVVADHRGSPRGVLRIGIPMPASPLIGEPVAELLSRYPELRVEITVADDTVSLLANTVDVVLTGGTVRGASTYGVMRIGAIGPVLATTQRYLDRAPPLRHPRDLADPGHTIVASGRTRRRRWESVHGKSGHGVVVEPAAHRALVTTKAIAPQLVVAGIGLALVPRTALLTLPGLISVEPGGYRPQGGPFSIVTPSARATSPKVRAFIDAMKAFVAARPDLFS